MSVWLYILPHRKNKATFLGMKSNNQKFVKVTETHRYQE